MDPPSANANSISHENLFYNKNFYPEYNEGILFCNLGFRKFYKIISPIKQKREISLFTPF